MSKNDNRLVLEFLAKANIVAKEKGFHISDMMYLLKEKDFFNEAINIFRSRKYYDENVWKFGFLHKNDIAVSELL